MTTIKGTEFLTIHASADETYELDYGTPPKLSIVNNTDADICIGYSPEFTDNADSSTGQYIKIRAGAAGNNIRFSFGKVYIKAGSSGGDIGIVR